MTALTKNVARQSRDAEIVEYPVKAGAKCYQGGIVEITAGNAEPATGGANKLIGGIAIEFADNSASGAANGDVTVKVRRKGALLLPMKSSHKPAIGAIAYIVDDNEVSSDAANTRLGYVIGWDAPLLADATHAWVDLDLA